jgi:hypothetical protein
MADDEIAARSERAVRCAARRWAWVGSPFTVSRRTMGGIYRAANLESGDGCYPGHDAITSDWTLAVSVDILSMRSAARHGIDAISTDALRRAPWFVTDGSCRLHFAPADCQWPGLLFACRNIPADMIRWYPIINTWRRTALPGDIGPAVAQARLCRDPRSISIEGRGPRAERGMMEGR